MATSSRRFLACALIWTAHSLAPTSALATLVYYYDPDSGNVSLDTAGTRTGDIFGWYLGLPHGSPYAFRHENALRLTGSQFYLHLPIEVGETSLSSTVSGYFTVGDILRPGIDEATWSRLFTPEGHGYSGYVDLIGQGTPPAPEFRYGQPERPYDNRWDVVDPNELTWASQATLRYHEATGKLSIDTTGPNSGHIATFTLESDGAFLADNFDPFISVPLTIASDSTLFIAADAIEPGVHSLGHVLEAGLSKTEFEAVFTEAMFIARAGFGGASFDFETDGLPMQLAYVSAVPEPAAALAVLLAVSGVSCPRRP